MNWKVSGLIICLLAIVGFVAFNLFFYVETKTDYHPHRSAHQLTLVDDQIANTNPDFDRDLVERRLLDGWEVNSSAAVLKLDCPDMRVDRYPALNRLYSNYSQAIAGAEKHYWKMLPSANLLDGSAKQFDDGMYAALDLAMFKGELGVTKSPILLVKTVYDRLDGQSPARAFISAGLSQVDEDVELDPTLAATKNDWIRIFEANEAMSKPIGFYDWNEELKKVWRFSKYFQYEFSEPAIPLEIAAAIRSDDQLLADFRKFNNFFGRLTNPPTSLAVDQLEADSKIVTLAEEKNVRPVVAVFPASTSRETELFNRIFANDLPQDVNLMAALIERVLSGEVDLKPREDSGWYDHQIFALETLLMPARGKENNKLLLTARYKKRLLEAFKALMTKRRETHARQGATAKVASEASRPKSMKPRLRVEPCATYFLRTARAYAFVADFLVAVAGEERLNQLKGLRRDGNRTKPLGDELTEMRDRFYGMYLVTCDDIGMKPEFAADEPVDQDACYELALQWLEQIQSDLDLKADTRVSVPIAYDIQHDQTRLWATLGVRLAHLKVNYEILPRIRQPGEADWSDFEDSSRQAINYLIAVDEFAELKLNGSSSLTRDELRAICDKHQTAAEIIESLRR